MNLKKIFVARKRQDPSSGIISQIIDAFFNAALKQPSVNIDPNLPARLRTAVTHDISTTLDQRVRNQSEPLKSSNIIVIPFILLVR